MKIYLESVNYATRRNILKNELIQNYETITNYSLILSKLSRYLFDKFGIGRVSISQKFRAFFYSLKKSDDGVFHSFNTVVKDERQWVSTFETVIPRVSSSMKFHHGKTIKYDELVNDPIFVEGLSYLAKDNCRAIIALSQCNFQMQKRILEYFPEYKEKILSKLHCLPPPQDLNITTRQNVSEGKKLKFMFVGNAFFCKGGEELIDVFISLRNKIDMELTVVSALLTDDYATNTNSNDITRVKNKILSCSDITLLSNINNDDVIELMRSHHVGILLSYAETYGYSVLEFQSTGCPVISTDIRALSEINSDSYGWIINVPKNELGEAIYNTELDRSIIKLKIESQLKKLSLI
ncbi:glycosyltransferase [Vibrio splendidus]|nr:glycosyltransferase [Vibrio splendidus]